MSTGELSIEIFSCLEVTWTVKADFLNKPGSVNHVLASKSFSFANADWRLELFPKGTDNSGQFVDVHLTRLNSPVPVHELSVKSCFKSRLGESYETCCDRYTFDILDPSCEINYHDRAKLRNHQELLLNGIMTAYCQIRVQTFSTNKSLEFDAVQQQIGAVASPPELHDASTQTETLDFNTRAEVLPEISSKAFPHIYRTSTDNLSTEQSSCVKVTWKIDDFLNKPTDANFVILSESFSFAEANWQLEMLPNGSLYNGSEGFIFVYLKRSNPSIPDQPLLIKSFFTASQNEHYKKFSWAFLYHNRDPSYRISEFPRSKLMTDKDILLQNDTLTMRCEIQTNFFTQDESSESSSHPLQTESEVCPVTFTSIDKLQSDYKMLLESKKEADVCLEMSDEEFRAHKCIFMARSPVFSAMSEEKDDTEEKASGEVVIEDLDPESFPVFLQHIYAGHLDVLSKENVFNLYTAADKYDMTDLKSECKSYMERTLSVDTFCDVMILSLRYHEDELLKVAIDFFVKNPKKIIVTEKWQMFSKHYNTEANALRIKALLSLR